jgi:hypothetical protein
MASNGRESREGRWQWIMGGGTHLGMKILEKPSGVLCLGSDQG